MSSLPNAIPDPAEPRPTFDLAVEATPGEGERFLLQAFRSFAETAATLERSYVMLQAEVTRLHGQLAQSHAGLARSSEENRGMRRRLDRILHGLPCGVLVTNEDHTIALVNSEARRLLATLPSDDGPAADCAGEFQALPAVPVEMRKLLHQAREEAEEREQRFLDRNGAEFWLAVRHAAVEDSGKESGGTHGATTNRDRVSVFILRDVSDTKRLIQERDKNRREQALAEMSAILAHEIRNPLGSLELFAGLLAKAGLPAEPQRWVQQVQSGLRTLAATANNVLHFHSLPVLERTPTDLGALIDWAGGFLVPMAREAGVELCLSNRLHGVRFSADRHRLEQVLLNLVLNAFRAMPGGGSVEISGCRISQENHQAAAISVSDTGPGLGVESVDRIFEPGFSTHPGSPGLGLAVCRKIIEQHGGTLTAVNRTGTGASFYMMFPLHHIDD